MQNAAEQARPLNWWNPRALLGRPNASLLDTLLPSLALWQKLAVSLLFVGLLTALGRARVFLPDNPVPITLQTFGVLATGGVMGWRWGAFTTIGWYLLGMAGAPVFQGGGNGWAYVSGGLANTQTGAHYVTGGFLIGYIFCAWLVGYFSQRGWTHSRTLWPMLLGALLLYVPGLLFWVYFSQTLTLQNMLSKGMYPYIPGDLLKVMAASIVAGALWTVADRRRAR